MMTKSDYFCGEAWTEEETALAIKLREEGFKLPDVSRILAERGYPNRSSKAIEKRIQRASRNSPPKTFWTEDEIAVFERLRCAGLSIEKIRRGMAEAGYKRSTYSVQSRMASYPRPSEMKEDISGPRIQDLNFKRAVLAAHPGIDIGVVKDLRPLGRCTPIHAIRDPLFSPEGSHF